MGLLLDVVVDNVTQQGVNLPYEDLHIYVTQNGHEARHCSAVPTDRV